jgi:hypothetical protein
MNICNYSFKWPAAVAVPLYVLVFALYPQVYCQAASWTVTAEEWARPRSGESLVQMEPLIATLQTLNMEPSSQLSIRYPGGEEGALWASELRDWLVSLGVPSGRIIIRPGQSSHENITLMLENLEEDEE